MPNANARTMFLLELNELNLALVEQAYAQHSEWTGIQKLLALQRTPTVCQDQYDSGFLEPWVQWVSVHTGQSSQEHGIKHLGDVPNLAHPQIWKRLDDAGISSGVFGVMNGDASACQRCHFFLPDPWTFSEHGRPESIAKILELPRYMSKNYLNLKWKTVFQKALLFFSGFKELRSIDLLLRTFTKTLIAAVQERSLKHYVFITVFEEAICELFLRMKSRHRPQFCVLFLNTMAHIQHHHWYQKNGALSAPIIFGLKSFNRSLEKIFRSLGEHEELFVANALDQKNTVGKETWILYRPKDPLSFLKSLNIKFYRVEPLMTHDAHVFFTNQEDQERAFQILSSAKVAGKPLFCVERDHADPLRIFYRVDFFDELPSAPDQKFLVQNEELLFWSHFQQIVTRTGKHVPTGFFLSLKRPSQARIQNHEIYNFILEHFEIARDRPRESVKTVSGRVAI